MQGLSQSTIEITSYVRVAGQQNFVPIKTYCTQAQLEDLEKQWHRENPSTSTHRSRVYEYIKESVNTDPIPEGDLTNRELAQQIFIGIKDGFVEWAKPTPSHFPLPVRVLQDGMKLAFVFCVFQTIYVHKFFPR